MSDAEFKKEQDYLAETIEVIEQNIDALEQNVQKQKDWALELKQQYIRDLRDYDQYEFADNYNKLNEILDFTDDQLAEIQRLQDIKDKPYFGRVDFKEDGEDAPLKLYIGVNSIQNDKKLFVVDWRAPISELFYESGKGKASYVAPDGKIDGEITLKRQYEIEKGKLIEFYDVDINLFDEYLRQVLAKTKGQKLENIASTIQKEQNDIIRNLKDDILIVQGYAGCGKTTIALHHIAYALYRLKDLKSVNVLFFSPNEAFFSYISKVLPELGEDNTRNATFSKFITRFLKTERPVENFDEFVNRYFFLAEEEKSKTKQKLDFSMREKMKKWIDNLSNTLQFLKDIEIDEKVFPKDDLNELLKNDFKHAKYREKIYLIANYIYKEIKCDSVGKKEYILSELVESLNEPVTIFELYDKMLTDFGYEKVNIDNMLPFEDAVLICVLKELTQNVVIRMDIKQIVIDEAQDYPLLFFDFLTRIYPHSNFCILGDINQKTTPDNLKSLNEIATLSHVKDRCKFIELDKTYRSSEEIVEYSSKLINKPRHNAFRLKYGQPVEELKLNNQNFCKQIENILNKVDYKSNTVGIVCGDREVAKQIFEHLSASKIQEDVCFVKNAYSVAGTQIEIVPISLAKGLEFDTVILVEKGKLFEEKDKTKFLYIAATRAINKLFVLKE